MTLVSLHHVSVAYDGCEALRDVDLQIDDRDFLGVIGPNGGGKTTLVKAILGTVPYTGEIVLSPELFRGEERVSDRALVPILAETCPPDASNPDDDPRTWYYALLDYGAYLKRSLPNPSRRSSGHVRQSRFEGSHRQKRAELVRILLAHRLDAPGGADLDTLAAELASEERKAGRSEVKAADVLALLEELSREGFCREERGVWRV